MAQFVVEWRIMSGGLCTWRWQFFCEGSWEVLVRMRNEDVHFEKKKFLTNSGRKKSAPSQRNPPAKIVLAKFLHQNDSKRLNVVSLHCWRCGRVAWATNIWTVWLARRCRRRFDPHFRSFSFSKIEKMSFLSSTFVVGNQLWWLVPQPSLPH